MREVDVIEPYPRDTLAVTKHWGADRANTTFYQGLRVCLQAFLKGRCPGFVSPNMKYDPFQCCSPCRAWMAITLSVRTESSLRAILFLEC